MTAVFASQAARLAGFALLALMASSPAAAQTRSPAQAEMPIDQLKRVYLDCERAVSSGDLGTEGVMGCSMAYEKLKRRAFDGDFRRLKAWFDTQREAAELVRHNL